MLEMNKTFGWRLTHAMELRGIRQKQLARITGVTEATVSRYVNEKRRPDIDFLREVVRALDVSADFLLGFTDDVTVKVNGMIVKPELSRSKYSIISRGAEDIVNIDDEDQVKLLDTFFDMVQQHMDK